MPQDVVIRGNIVYLRIGANWFAYDRTSAPIGAGAMGIVHLGKCCSNGQAVAIKEVRVQYANIPEIRKRAKTEASLMFMHHNLIEMLGYCETSPNSGPIWIVSKFVQGMPIDKYVKSQNIPEAMRAKRIVHIFMPVLQALSYLHSKNIWHLDIKPSNIMVEHGNNVRVLDLGIADTQNGIIAGNAPSQSSQQYMGTPNYAAPEQFSRESTLSAATDIYEAGVSLYELITGNNPFAAHTLQETLEKHNNIILPAHSCVPTRLLKVLQKATHREKDKRYQSAQEFTQALQDSLRPRRWFKRPIVIACICLIIIITVASLLLLFISFSHQS